MKYGEPPKQIGILEVECQEMMFYQYLPIKLPHSKYVLEPRLECFRNLIEEVCFDFVGTYSLEVFKESYIYLTAKHLYQLPNTSFNRLGWHSDGFMTDDINYIWCDKFPTVFNTSDFNLTMNDSISMREMEEQAFPVNDITYGNNTLLRLNQFNIHKVADVTEGGMRTFVKVSFSKDKYDLIGNSHNYNLDYNWKMKQRKQERNIPQSLVI